MKDSDLQRIEHIRRYCIDISDFVVRFGNSFDAFINDRAYYNAVSMCLLQIGELANGLSEEFRKNTNQQMPWAKIRGMRNWLAHAYSEVDEEMVWATVKENIPELLSFCDMYLQPKE